MTNDGITIVEANTTQVMFKSNPNDNYTRLSSGVFNNKSKLKRKRLLMLGGFAVASSVLLYNKC